MRLNPQLRQLCSPNNAVTNLLFGDDLSKQLETIEKTNQVKNCLSSQGFSPEVGRKQVPVGQRMIEAGGKKSRQKTGGRRGVRQAEPPKPSHAQELAQGGPIETTHNRAYRIESTHNTAGGKCLPSMRSAALCSGLA